MGHHVSNIIKYVGSLKKDTSMYLNDEFKLFFKDKVYLNEDVVYSRFIKI